MAVLPYFKGMPCYEAYFSKFQSVVDIEAKMWNGYQNHFMSLNLSWIFYSVSCRFALGLNYMKADLGCTFQLLFHEGLFGLTF